MRWLLFNLIPGEKSRKSLCLDISYAVGNVKKILLIYHMKDRTYMDKVGSFLVY